MKKKYPFIKSIDLLLQLIWYFQWFFGLVLILSAFAILTELKLFDINKITGFHINFSEIDMGNVMVQDGLTHNVTITNGTGRIHIGEFKQKIIIFRIMAAFLELVVSMYIIFTLRKIFSNLKIGDFFVRINGLLLSKIAFAIVSISIFLTFYQYIFSYYLFNNFQIENIVLKRNLDFDTRTIIFGLMIFVIAKIFIKGAELKEEQDLTI